MLAKLKARAVAAGGALLLAGLAMPSSAQDLDLKRVMLSTGGVGYFEYEAMVTGDAALSLEVRLDQVDDVLKSIVVYDDKGGIGTISLPGREPLKEIFREMPFAPDALSSPIALLNAVRGAEIEVSGNRDLEGRLISVTEERMALPNNQGVVSRHRVSILTEDGIRQALLEDANAITFLDDRLNGQVQTALAAVAEHAQQDRRRLAIQTQGAGERRVRVAYVVEAPLWKSAYRLTLGGATPDQGDLQGWAVLENLSGEDWEGVELTVASGNPVTFRQQLYNAYFVDRPEVPVEVLGRVLPQTDEGAMPAPAPQVAERKGYRPRALAMAAAAPPPPAPSGGIMMSEAEPDDVFADSAPGGAAELVAAESSEATTQVVFRYPLPVTVANGQSLLLPIIARAAPARPVALYQPETHPLHPLASVELANDGETGLPPGILTLYERDPASGVVSYVGDARLNALPAGEDRLLSFAVDQKVRIDRRDDTTQTLTRATIADGLLRLTRTEQQTSTYTINGAAREARTVLIEHPRRAGGWSLVTPQGPSVSMTPTAWRLTQEVAAGAVEALTVVQERPRYETVRLSNLSTDRIAAYASSRELAPEIRKAFETLAGLSADAAEKDRVVHRLERQRRETGDEQARLRENLGAVPRESDLYRRYLARLGESEDDLEALARSLDQARAAQDAARRAVLDYVQDLTI